MAGFVADLNEREARLREHTRIAFPEIQCIVHVEYNIVQCMYSEREIKEAEDCDVFRIRVVPVSRKMDGAAGCKNSQGFALLYILLHNIIFRLGRANNP